MVKVLINRKPRIGPYGGGNHFVRAFYDLAKDSGVEICETLSERPDIIFVFHPDSENGSITMRDAVFYRMAVNRESKLVIRVNECDARKGTKGVDDLWKKMIDASDHVFFVSNWMKEYFKCERGDVLINGIDRTRFVKQPKLSKTNGKINIVCAHWSDNPLKGQDTYEFLDDFVKNNTDFTFTYIGRTKADLKNSILIPALPPEELAKELTRYDVCVNGTFSDPGPNAVMESIAAGLPTYVRSQGGGAAEFAGAEHVYNSVEELKSILLTRDYKPNVDRFDDWQVVMKTFFEKVKSL